MFPQIAAMRKDTGTHTIRVDAEGFSGYGDDELHIAGKESISSVLADSLRMLQRMLLWTTPGALLVVQVELLLLVARVDMKEYVGEVFMV